MCVCTGILWLQGRVVVVYKFEFRANLMEATSGFKFADMHIAKVLAQRWRENLVATSIFISVQGGQICCLVRRTR